MANRSTAAPSAISKQSGARTAGQRAPEVGSRVTLALASQPQVRMPARKGRNQDADEDPGGGVRYSLVAGVGMDGKIRWDGNYGRDAGGSAARRSSAKQSTVKKARCGLDGVADQVCTALLLRAGERPARVSRSTVAGFVLRPDRRYHSRKCAVWT